MLPQIRVLKWLLTAAAPAHRKRWSTVDMASYIFRVAAKAIQINKPSKQMRNLSNDRYQFIQFQKTMTGSVRDE